AEDGIRDFHVTGVQTCALPILNQKTVSVLGAVKSASGTSVDFTGIPPWVTKITLTMAGISFSDSGGLLCVQIGDSGGIESSVYDNYNFTVDEALDNAIVWELGDDEFVVNGNIALPGSSVNGTIEFNLVDPATNTWVINSTIIDNETGVSAGPKVSINAGSKSLSAALDRI